MKTEKLTFKIDPGIYNYTITLEEPDILPKHLTDEPRTAKQIFLQEVNQ